MAARKCEICGADLPEGLLQGLCPKCVLKQVMAEGSASEASDLAAPQPDGAEAPRSPGAGSAAAESPPSQPTAAPPASEQPGDHFGRYKLLQKLGEGGMGSVWRAEQTEPVRRMVALKVIKPGMDSKEVLGRFEAERQALALMDHPNIARVFDGGVTPSGAPTS